MNCLACNAYHNNKHTVGLCIGCYDIYQNIKNKYINCTVDSCAMCNDKLNRAGDFCVKCSRKLNLTGSMHSNKMLLKGDFLWNYANVGR
jgi:hypothetical protein